jgi:hypothetical protein
MDWPAVIGLKVTVADSVVAPAAPCTITGTGTPTPTADTVISVTFELAVALVNVTAGAAKAVGVHAADNVVPLNEPLLTAPPAENAVATSVAVAIPVAVNVRPATVID